MQFRYTLTGTRLENLGIAEEELLRQQQELFAQARQQMNEEFQQQQFGLQAQSIETKQSSDDEEYWNKMSRTISCKSKYTRYCYYNLGIYFYCRNLTWIDSTT